MRCARDLAVLSILVLSLAFGAAGAPAPNDPKGRMDEIFFLSGLEDQLALIGEGLGEALTPQLQQLPPAQGETIQRVVLSEFNADALQRGVERHLERAHDPRYAGTVLAWLRSPLGRRITKLDVAAARPEGMRAMQAYAEAIASNPAPATRVGLVTELDAATGMTDFTLDATLSSATATAIGINGAQPPAQRLDESELRAALEAQRSALRPEIQKVTMVSMLYSYQDLSDEELARYIEFSESEPGRWYHDVVKRALLNTLTDASSRVGYAIAAELDTAPQSVPASPAH
jgi:hypothetical protein